MLTEYSLLLRPGEVGYQPRSDEKSLHNECVTWHPNFETPQDLSMKVDAAKTNRWKLKTKIIYVHCNCDKSVRIISGLVQLLKNWIDMRNAYHEVKFKSNDFIFLIKVEDLLDMII